MALSLLQPNSKTHTKSNQHQWKVTDETTISLIRSKKHVEGPIFRMQGFVWRLGFQVDLNKISDNSTVSLRLMDIPPKVDRVIAAMILFFDELDVRYSMTKVFSEATNMNRGWGKNLCKTSDVLNLPSFTFGIELDVISVYNKEDDDVTAFYVNTAVHSSSAPKSDFSISIQELNVKVDSLTEAVEMIQNRMDEEEKENDNNLQQQIDEMKETLKRMTVKMSVNEENTEEAVFKKWVVDTLKYPEYYELFIENGVETLNVAKLLTKSELKAIGINKIGHQLQIMEEITALKMKQNSDKPVAAAYQQPVEGGTLML